MQIRPGKAGWGLGCPSRACGHGQCPWQVSGLGVGRVAGGRGPGLPWHTSLCWPPVWGPGCPGLSAPGGSGSVANSAARGGAGVHGVEPGWFPARARVGSGSSWLTSAFEASYLIGPRWLVAIFLSRSVREGLPCAHLGSPPPPPSYGKGPQTPPQLPHCCIQHLPFPLTPNGGKEQSPLFVASHCPLVTSPL